MRGKFALTHSFKKVALLPGVRGSPLHSCRWVGGSLNPRLSGPFLVELGKYICHSDMASMFKI